MSTRSRTTTANTETVASWERQTNEEGKTAITLLMEWITEAGNLDAYLGDNDSGATKEVVAGRIKSFLNDEGIDGRSVKSIMGKIDRMLAKYRDTIVWKNATGAGIMRAAVDARGAAGIDDAQNEID
ncbi:hypothetical protein ABG067_008508, partial [Albugo candida]